MEHELSYRYIHPHALLVINPSGVMRKLYTPFRVKCVEQTENIPPESWVIVDEVIEDIAEKLLYKIQGRKIAYYYFQIEIKF